MGTILGILSIVLVAVGLLLARSLVPMFFRAVGNARRGISTESRATDATALNIPPTTGAARAAERLKALGFTPFGTVKTVDPARDTPILSWLYTDAARTVTAEVLEISQIPALISLTTWFADDSCVEMVYPIGERIHDPDFVCQLGQTSIEGAYQEHQRAVTAHARKHGEPRPLVDMAEHLRRETVYQRDFAPRKNVRLIRQSLSITSLGLLLSLTSLIAGFYLFFNRDSLLAFFAVVVLLFGLSGSLYLISRSLIRGVLAARKMDGQG